MSDPVTQTPPPAHSTQPAPSRPAKRRRRWPKVLLGLVVLFYVVTLVKFSGGMAG